MAVELAPGVLVAAPTLLDPNFKRAVVLLVDHPAMTNLWKLLGYDPPAQEGSFGFVINRSAELTLPEMVPRLSGDYGEATPPDSPVLLGGPVQPETGWLLFDAADTHDLPGEHIRVADGVHLSGSKELLEAVIRGEGPSRHVLVLGYAGWAPEQLDAEISQGAWIPVDVDRKLIFDLAYEDRWGTALRSAGIDPARLAFTPPSQA